MAQRVTAIFRDRASAERAGDSLTNLGAEREHLSILNRGEDDEVTRRSGTTAHEGDDLVEPAREVGDSGAALTTTDSGDAAKGAAIGAVAGLAAGLLALTVPGIGLVLAAGPLAAAMAGGAVVGGVYGGLRDLGIEEQHARGYEERIRSGHVLLTALLPNIDPQQVLDLLVQHGGEDISLSEAASSVAAATPEVNRVSASSFDIADRPVTAPHRSAEASSSGMATTAGATGARTVPTPGEIRVPVTEETAEVRKEEREVQLRHERVEVEEDEDAEVESVAPSTTRRDA